MCEVFPRAQGSIGPERKSKRWGQGPFRTWGLFGGSAGSIFYPLAHPTLSPGILITTTTASGLWWRRRVGEGSLPPNNPLAPAGGPSTPRTPSTRRWCPSPQVRGSGPRGGPSSLGHPWPVRRSPALLTHRLQIGIYGL